MIPVYFNGFKVTSLVDTGANTTIMSINTFNQMAPNQKPILNLSTTDMILADGRAVPIAGRGKMRIEMGPATLLHEVWVANIEPDAIIGIDVMKETECIIDPSRLQVQIGDTVLQSQPDPPPSVYTVRAAETVVIKPGHELILPGKLDNNSNVDSPCMIMEPDEGFSGRSNLMVARVAIHPVEGKSVPIRLANCSTEPQIIYKNTKVANCQVVEAVLEPNQEPPDGKISSNDYEGFPEHLTELLEDSSENLTAYQKAEVKSLLREYKDVFSTSKTDLGRSGIVRHKISTQSPPIRQAPRRLPIHKRNEAKEQVENMLNQGVIEPSASPWSSPVVLVKKKDGSMRFCVDYRKLNDVTKKDSYPLPRINDSLDRLEGAKWFSTLDLSSGYWQIEMDGQDMEKTAFATESGFFHFNVMPFGLCNAPATFERLMEQVLHGLQWEACLVYLDDIIVFGQTFEQEIQRLREVFQRMRDANLKLSPKKCTLFKKEVAFLGHVVSSEGVSTDPSKIAAVENWPRPTTVREVRSFAGLCSYYRRFVREFARIARPLHKLTEKGTRFEWTSECETAFNTLKMALTSSPILAFPQEAGTFILDTDASNDGVGAVLSQVQDGHERVVAYFSRALAKAERQYCVTRKELLALVAGVKHFHPYIYGSEFLIRTDHAALRWLMGFKNPEGQIARWLELLGTYNFKVQHRPGKQHGNADGLSRRPCEDCRHCERQEVKETPPHEEEENTPRIAAVTVDPPTSENLSEFTAAQRKDKILKQVIEWNMKGKRPEWEEVSPAGPRLKAYWLQWDRLDIRDGILMRRWENEKGDEVTWQIVVPESKKDEILKDLHDHKVAGHLGTTRTVKRIQERLYWTGYRRDVENWCKTCPVCGARKPPQQKPKAKMKQFNVGEPMERIAIDIMGPLPVTQNGDKYIMVVADYFTKWTEAYAIPDQTAETVAAVLVEEFICRFGTPVQIHTDQGRNFESNLFREVCRLLDIDKTRTTPFHPQSDGMVERFNRTLQAMLSKVVAPDQRDWDKWLPYVMMAYRSSTHVTTKYSPSEMMLGRNTRLPIDVLLPRPPDADDEGKTYADQLRDKMEKIHDLARHNVKAASDRQKANYDKRAIIRPHKAGDMVWLQNHATKKGLSPKLRQHWIGPYKILNKLSDVTYRIKKEPIGKPKVVHHNRLKPYCERLKPKAVSRKKSSAKTEAREMYPTFLRQRRPPKRYGYD